MIQRASGDKGGYHEICAASVRAEADPQPAVVTEQDRALVRWSA